MRAFPFVAMAASLLLSSIASGQTSKPRRLHAYVGAEALVFAGTRCDQDLDSVTCQSGSIFPAFVAGASYRAHPLFSIGGRFSAATANVGVDSPSRAPRHLSIFEVTVEPRVHPFGEGPADPWIGAVLGYGSMRQTSAEIPEKTTKSSLVAGASLGVQFRLGDWLALAPELRAVFMNFSPSNADHDGKSTTYQGKLWLGVALQLVALLPV